MAAPATRDVVRYVSARIRELYPTSSAKKKAPGEWTLGEIAKELNTNKDQVMKARAGTGGVGPVVVDAFVRRHFDNDHGKFRQEVAAWAEANPETVPTTAPAGPTFESDRIHPVIEAVRAHLKLPRSQAVEASRMVYAYGGTADLTHEQARIFLEKAGVDIRTDKAFVESVVGESGRGALDELGGTAPPRGDRPTPTRSRTTGIRPPGRRKKGA